MTTNKRTTSEKSPWIETQNVNDLVEDTGNIYASINIMSNRSRQIANELKEELNSKLEEFASSIDNLEEVHENREQIEISKYYEKLPHPTILSLEEFTGEDTYFRFRTVEESIAFAKAEKERKSKERRR